MGAVDHTAEAAVIPHGVTEDAGWALARLNDGNSPSSGEVDYRFPEATRPVRLYLVDSAVDNTSGWFNSNTNLTFTQSLRIVGGGSPPVAYDPNTDSASIDHGTRMLSVIAGSERGAACGIPIELFSYDIYPAGSGGASNIGLLISAILDATTTHEIARLSDPDLLGVLCIANGTGDPTSSPTLLNAIYQAVGVGLTVIVSAGNDGADALNGNSALEVINGTADAYLPGAYGSSLNGVITVGASDLGNAASSLSNYGAAVDLWAPGVDVPTFDPGAPAGGQSSLMQGTSPAAGLATAAAIAELSRQPALDPAGLENELKQRLYAGTVSIVQIDDDLDADGSVDELERFFGYPINDASSFPPSPAFCMGEEVCDFSFSIAASLWQPEDPMNLADGSSWRLLASTDMVEWIEISTFISVGPEAHSRVPVAVVLPEDGGLGEEGATSSHVITSEEYVTHRESLKGDEEKLKEKHTSDPNAFPAWYWEILGYEEAQSEAVSDTAPSSSRVFYRIEVIVNP